MQLIDTSDTAVTQRARRVMDDKHLFQMQVHQTRFGKLGVLQTKGQKRALAVELRTQQSRSAS